MPAVNHAARRDCDAATSDKSQLAAIIAGLLPIMLGSGTGSEVMRRIAAPMVGGMVSATLLTLVVIPAVFLIWKQHGIRNRV